MKVTRSQILAEIGKLASANGGIAPGALQFEKQTGIRKSDWSGVYWARWSDAVKEAGFSPNRPPERLERDYIMEKIALACRHFGHIPTVAERRLYRKEVDHSFPRPHEPLRKEWIIANLSEWLRDHPEFADVAAFASVLTPESESEDDSVTTEGCVYLIKWGTHYKIGRTGNIERRFKEVQTNLPNKGEVIHTIRTDDPAGIETYWHKRFADRRAPNGEWFNLTAADVRAFKRRRFM